MDTKETHIKEIGLYAQNLLIILDSIVNNSYFYFGGEDLHDHLMRKRIFTLIMDKIFKRGPKIIRKMAMALIWSHWSAHSAYYPKRSGLIGESSHSRPLPSWPILKVWLEFQIWSQKKQNCRLHKENKMRFYQSLVPSEDFLHSSLSLLHQLPPQWAQGPSSRMAGVKIKKYN